MVVGISMVRDEADIVGFTVARMLEQVDHVIVADNLSTDGTKGILEAFDRVTVIDDTERGYFQARKMTALAAVAADMGARWVVPFDGDECWYSPFGRIADVLMEQRDATIAPAALFDHVTSGQDPDDPDPITRIGWRREAPAPLPKVAVRPVAPVAIHQGNHSAGYAHTAEGLLVVRHYPYRSPEQVVSKIRNGADAYAATDLPEHEGAHWRQWGRILSEQGEDAIADLFRKWHWRADPTVPVTIDQEFQPPLIFDPAPCPAPAS